MADSSMLEKSLIEEFDLAPGRQTIIDNSAKQFKTIIIWLKSDWNIHLSCPIDMWILWKKYHTIYIFFADWIWTIHLVLVKCRRRDSDVLPTESNGENNLLWSILVGKTCENFRLFLSISLHYSIVTSNLSVLLLRISLVVAKLGS